MEIESNDKYHYTINTFKPSGNTAAKLQLSKINQSVQDNIGGYPSLYINHDNSSTLESHNLTSLMKTNLFSNSETSKLSTILMPSSSLGNNMLMSSKMNNSELRTIHEQPSSLYIENQNNIKSLADLYLIDDSAAYVYDTQQQIALSKRRYSLRNYEFSSHNQESMNNDQTQQQQAIWLPFQQEFREQFLRRYSQFLQRNKKNNIPAIKLNNLSVGNNNSLTSQEKRIQSRRKSKTIEEHKLSEIYSSAQSVIVTPASKVLSKTNTDTERDSLSSVSSLNQSQFKQKYLINNSFQKTSEQLQVSPHQKSLNESSVLKSNNVKNSEKIKQYNISSKLDIKDPEISEIVILILQKNCKSTHEIKFLQKCIEGMPLFQKHQGLFDKANNSHQLFSQIKHVKYQKNHVVFNFGEFGYHYYIVLKEELIAKQKKIEQMQQRLKRLQSKNKNSIFSKQECGRQFVDIVMQAFKQKKEQSQKEEFAKLKSEGKPVPNMSEAIMNKKKSKLGSPKSQLPAAETLKQNQLFNQFLQKKGINLTQKVDKQPFLGRRSNLLDTDINKRLRKQSKMQPALQPLNQNQQEIGEQNPNADTSTSEQNKLQSSFEDPYKNESMNQYLERNFPEFKMVKIFFPGESFGEIALMTKERRTATMVCQEETHLMVLSKEGFDKIIGAFQQQILREKLDFLRKFQFLDSLPTSQLMSLLHYFKINTYQQKTVIYNEGDKVTDIYFIKTGEVEILKTIVVEDNEYQQSKREYESSSRLFEMNLTLKNKMKQKKTEMASIKLLGSGQCFGEEEVIEDTPKRQYKVVVTQHSEIFSISKEYVLSSLKSQKGLNILQKQKQLKQSWINERENFITVKKAETNNKIQEQLQTIEKAQRTKLDYSDMQSNQMYKSYDSDKVNEHITLQRSLSSSPTKLNNKSFLSHQPQKHLLGESDNLTEIGSPLSPILDGKLNYPLLDQLKLNQSFSQHQGDQKSHFKTSQSLFHQEAHTPLISPGLLSMRNKGLLSEIRDLKEKKLQNEQLQLDLAQISKGEYETVNLEKANSQILPNISLFDYKPQQIELEFNSHSKYIELQEMTTRSKVDNYSLLIKNKNQIAETRNNPNDRNAIQVDLFKDDKKKKQITNNGINKSIRVHRTQSPSEFSQTQTQSFTRHERPNGFENQHIKARATSQQKKSSNKTYSCFYNTSSTFKQKESIPQKIVEDNAGLSQDKLKEIQKDIANQTLSSTGFSAFKANLLREKPVTHSSSPHSLQQHLKKGSTVNFMSQSQSTHFVAKKHITEFTREVRNKQQNSINSNQITSKKRNSISSGGMVYQKKPFISQIDFTDIVNDQIGIPSIENSPVVSSYPNNNDWNYYDPNEQNIIFSQRITSTQNNQLEQYKAIPKRQQNKSSGGGGNNYSSEGAKSSGRIRQKSMEEFPQNGVPNRCSISEKMIQFPENQNSRSFQERSFSQQNQARISINNHVNNTNIGTDKNKYNPHSSSQNYTFATLYNNNDSVNTAIPPEGKKQRFSYNSLIASQPFPHRRNYSQNNQTKMTLSTFQQENSSQQILGNSDLLPQRSVNNISQKSFNIFNEQQISYYPSNANIDQKRMSPTLSHLNKDMVRTFKLDKIISNEAEKNFIKLASSNYQQLSDIKQSQLLQGNLNSLKYLLTSNLSGKIREKHNQRLIDLCNTKKKINSQLSKDASSSLPPANSSLQKKIFRGQQQQQQQNTGNTEGNTEITNNNLLLQSMQFTKPS